MKIALFHVDAFTDEPFTGNPAAVCILPKLYEPAWMQQVAAEMNLSETAFLHRDNTGWNLRWFTPIAEVDLCGHATLASAHTLYESGNLRPNEPAIFHTRSGELRCEHGPAGIRMHFPRVAQEPTTAPFDLSTALGTRLQYVGKTKFDFLIEVEDEKTLRELEPNMDLLKTMKARGFIVTAPTDHPELDFVTRFFAPAYGIPEDPVTGSAHCTLAEYWGHKLNKTSLAAHQISTRGGRILMEIEHNGIALSGKAVTVMRGELIGPGSSISSLLRYT